MTSERAGGVLTTVRVTVRDAVRLAVLLAGWLWPLAPARAHPVDEEPAGSPYEGRLTLYLNRCAAGLPVQPGEVSDPTLDVSRLLTVAVELFPYPHGDASWDAVLAHTRAVLQPFDIVVTDADPSPEPHDEVVVCGNALEVGYAGLPGAAPLRCEPGQNPMAFVFAEDAAPRDRERHLAELVVQEAAHAWSLDHVLGCEDMMGFDADCGPRTLVDAELDCGTDVLMVCDCGGKEQNSFHVVAGLFGLRALDRTPPQATIVEPTDAAVIDEGAEIDVIAAASDDFAVAELTLVLDGEAIASVRGAEEATWPLQGLGAGEHTLQLTASDQDGNVADSDAITVTVQANAEAGSGTASDGGSGDAGEGGSSGSDVDTTEGADDADDAEATDGPSPGGCSCRGTQAPSHGVVALLVIAVAVRRRN